MELSVQLLLRVLGAELFLTLDGQILHVIASGTPERKVPGGQTKQKALASRLVNEPGGHALQLPEAASRLYVPTLQGKHCLPSGL